MEIFFITGKGGVGKSAVAAGFALQKAQSGQKTLLVELGDQSFYQDYFSLPLVGYSPTPSGLGFDVALWSGPECLREYALHLIKIQSLFNIFFENPVTKALINVAPGLAELAILGKITSGPPRNVGPKMDYDVLIVDSFATGHFLALLRAPQGMAQAVRVGPMGDQSRAIEKVLADPKMCKYFIVSLPEDLPVIEGLELGEQIEKLVGIKPTYILNRVVHLPESSVLAKLGPAEPSAFQEHLMTVSKRQNEIYELYRKKKIEPFSIAHLFMHDPVKITQSLSRELPHA